MTDATNSITHSRVLKIAVPIVISNATVPILGAVDTGVVGQLGEAAPIGAVGVGAIILTALYWIFGFLRMGTTGLTGQAHGRGETGEVAALWTRSVLIGFIAGVVLIALQSMLFAGAFLVSPATPEVETMARDYMQIRIYSAPAAIALYGLTGWLIALERTRAVLAIQVVMNGLNIALDMWFVLGLDWGVTGVAWATFIAEWSGAALGLFLCRDVFANTLWRNWAQVFDRVQLYRMTVVNTDILIRSLLLQAMFVSFLLLGARFGEITLAANQVLLQFLYITAYAQDGFAFAAEALVSQSLGAKSRQALRRSAVISSQWGFGSCVVMALTFWVGGSWIIDLMTTAPDVRTEGRVYLIYMILAPILGCASWMFDGIFIGATRSRDMRNMMAVSFVIYLMALVLLLPKFGNHGLWIALLISFVARGATLWWKYPALESEAG